jgi:4-amino-4-deoxy-L-arabinose transferase-like glycosyltransferase
MKALSPVSCLLLGFGLAVFLVGIGANSIYILDEAKNAEAAREMWESGNWFYPTFNGEPRYDKPPLHYFLFGIAYKLMGVTAFSARFFPALAGWVCSLLVFLKVRRRFGENAAIVAYLSLIASVQWGIQFRLAVPDPFLILFLTASVLQLEGYLSDKSKPKKYLYSASALLGLAFLSKGPVSVVLVLGTILIFSLIHWRALDLKWRHFLDLWAVLIFCLVALPWYFFVYFHYGGDWLSQFIFKHNLSRFSAPMEGHGGPVYFPLLFALGGFFPASLLLFVPWKGRFKRLKSDSLLMISLIFVLVTVGFFSISSTKLPGYVAPVFPFLAILVAGQTGKLEGTKAFFPIFVLMGLGLLVFPLGLYFTRSMQLSNFGFSIPYWYFLFPLFALGLAIFWIGSRRKSLTLLLLGYGVLKLVLFVQVVPLIDRNNPVTQSLPFLEGKTEVYYWREFNPAFPFQLKRIIRPWTGESFGEVLIITEQKHLATFSQPFQVVFRAKDQFENKETVIIKPQPVLP